MASGTAHELNNILYPILIYTNMLLEKAEVGSEEYEDLSEILDCAEGTVKVHLHKGRQRLADRLGLELGEAS